MHPFLTIIEDEINNDSQAIEKVYTALKIPHEPTEKKEPSRNSDGSNSDNGHNSEPN